VIAYGWEGNGRFGIALTMCYRRKTFVNRWAQWSKMNTMPTLV